MESKLTWLIVYARDMIFNIVYARDMLFNIFIPKLEGNRCLQIMNFVILSLVHQFNNPKQKSEQSNRPLKPQ